MTPSSHWKKLELWYCRDLGAERTGPMGKHLADCLEGSFPISAEIKTRKDLPKYLEKMLVQSETEGYEGFIPVVILHPHGNSPGDAVVLMRYDNMKRLRDWRPNENTGS